MTSSLSLDSISTVWYSIHSNVSAAGTGLLLYWYRMKIKYEHGNNALLNTEFCCCCCFVVFVLLLFWFDFLFIFIGFVLGFFCCCCFCYYYLLFWRFGLLLFCFCKFVFGLFRVCIGDSKQSSAYWLHSLLFIVALCHCWALPVSCCEVCIEYTCIASSFHIKSCETRYWHTYRYNYIVFSLVHVKF